MPNTMPAPTSIDELRELVHKSGVLEDKRLETHLDKLRAAGQILTDPAKLAAALVRDGLLTNFQAEQLLQGKWRRFTIGKYKVLERLGSGGMGSVFLCEHKFMRRRVAVKVLPTAKAADPSSLERFYREARAVAAVDHPNIVHAYDIDQDENLHFLVMEYVDGPSLQDIVRRTGPVSVERACHYISQSAMGLDHASKAGLVHRDIKPGNILVDRTGVVKILDMGLARFFNDEEDMLTRKYDENVLGTADYLAPEQADDSHEVDTRADIYSLGGTFYFLLTGKTPFGEGTVPQKLMWHRTRQPKPLSASRDDVPAGVQAVLDKMMAKEPGQRYQTAVEISTALAEWTQTPVPPPSEAELPRLSPAAVSASSAAIPPTIVASSLPGAGRKNWQVTGASKPPPSGETDKPIITKPPSSAPPAKAPSSPRPGTSTAPKPAIKSTVAKEEESSPWATMGPDTADPAARGDTPPQTPSRARRPKKAAVPPAPKPAERRQNTVLIATVAGLAVLLIGLITAAYFLGLFRGSRGTLKVGKSGAYPTVKAALAAAKRGDKIVLLDADHRECVAYEGDDLADIQIQPADGVDVVWAPPKGGDPQQPLLSLGRAKGFQVRGVRITGEGKTKDLIKLAGNSPGLKLENVTFDGFTHAAIIVSNCSGSAEQPVRLADIKTSPTPGAKAAIVLDGSPTTLTHITMQNCRFDGQYGERAVYFTHKDRSPTVIGP
jgi:serine/threonine protein kinase